MGRETKKTPFLRQQGGRLDDGRRAGSLFSLSHPTTLKCTIENSSPFSFFVAKFFVGFWLKWVVTFSPSRGGQSSPSPRCKKSRTPISNLCLFFLCLLCIYRQNWHRHNIKNQRHFFNLHHHYQKKTYTFIARRGRIQKGILSIIIGYSNYKL